MQEPSTGAIVWCDLTVPDAQNIKSFYQQVVGWKASAVSMGDYDDFSMQLPDSGQDVAGICHARGGNADLPAQWMMYFKVEDLDDSIAQCETLGGKTLTSMKHYGDTSRYIIVQDPAGAVCALFEDKAT